MKRWFVQSVAPLRICSRWCHTAAGASSTAAPSLHLQDALKRVVNRIPTSDQHRVSSVQLLHLVKEHGGAAGAVLGALSLDDLKVAVTLAPESLQMHIGTDGAWTVSRLSAPTLTPSSPPTAAASTTSTVVNPRVRSMEVQIRRCLRSGRHADAAGFVSLKQIAATCGWTREEYEFALHTVLPRVLQSEQSSASSSSSTSAPSLLRGLEVKPVMSIRPKMKRRGCHVFVDADGFSKQDCQSLLSTLAVDPKLSTQSVVRHPSTGSHSGQDIVTTYDLPPYLVLEKQARLLCSQDAPLLKDIVFACSDAHFDLYAKSVAPKLVKALRYSSMYVCCPSRVACLRHDDDVVCL
jgi:hypothetical protein